MSDVWWPWTGWWRKKFWSSRAGTQADAADFNLAVTLVAPWEEYVIDLSPAFTLKDGDTALNHVIPDTGSLEEKILDSWSGSAQASVAVAAKDTSNGGGAAAPAAAGDRDQKADKGKAGKGAEKHEEHKPVAGAVGAEHAPSKQPRVPGAGHATGKDPMLEFAAATALYQEVKLLNRYVADAALRRDYRAYVVRLQMSVVPFARNFPLDVYTNISFFPVRASKGKLGAKLQRSYAEVIPLLVTDNLENTVKSRTVDSLRNLAVTLNFLKPGLGSGASLGRRREDFKHALGGDLNSLLTVGRVSDNTLQIRLGAERDTSGRHDYTILPRTHNITVLLMVPREFAEDPDFHTVPRITAVSKTQLRYAETGTELDREGENGRRKRVENVVSRALPSQEVDVDKLLQSVFDNDVDAFEDQVKMSEVRMLDLWCDIVETLGKSEFAAVRFELPPPARLPDEESVLAIDDGEQTVMRLQGGAGLNQNGVTATLLVKSPEGEIRIAPHAEPPGTEVNILAGGHGMTIKFPSLRALNIDVGRPPRDGDSPLRLRVGYAEGRKWSPAKTEPGDRHKVYMVIYRQVKSQRRQPQATVRAENGRGNRQRRPAK